MNLEELTEKVILQHQGTPGRLGLAKVALEDLRRGLVDLAKLGTYVGLTQEQAPKGDEYPRVLYRDIEIEGGYGPGVENTTVHDRSAHDSLLTTGWRETPRAVEPPVNEPATADEPSPGSPPTFAVSVDSGASGEAVAPPPTPSSNQ